MTAIAYFADLPDGTTIEFRDRVIKTGVTNTGRQLYRTEAAKVSRCIIPTWPTVGDGNALCGLVPGKGWVRITRTVKMKANPSKHVCDIRCTNAKGRVMNCECSCGGKNHGKGRFVCEAALGVNCKEGGGG